MRRMLAAAVLVALAAGTVLAGPPRPREVPAGAKWMIHLDAERLMQGQLGALVEASVAERGLDAKLKVMEAMFSINPLKDILDVTVCGKDGREENVLIYVRGHFDRAKLEAIAGALKDYGSSEHGDTVIHHWKDERPRHGRGGRHRRPAGGMTYGAFARDDLIVLGHQEAAVAEALDAIGGDVASLADGANGWSLDAAPDGFFFLALADGLQGMEGVHPKAVIVKELESGMLSFTENAEAIKGRLAVRTRSEESAKEIAAMLNGLMAFGKLAEEEHADLAALANNAVLSSAGQDVSIVLDLPMDKVKTVVQEHLDKAMRRHEGRGPEKETAE